jgi:hypothetical protein
VGCCPLLLLYQVVSGESSPFDFLPIIMPTHVMPMLHSNMCYNKLENIIAITLNKRRNM